MILWYYPKAPQENPGNPYIHCKYVNIKITNFTWESINAINVLTYQKINKK